MIFNRNKKQKENDQKQQETLREKVLADPKGYGLRGSLSDGINKDRMLDLAREYEEKEKKRIEARGPRIEETKNRARSPNAPERKKEEPMPVPRKELREFPEILNTRWLFSARLVELQKLLEDNGRPSTDGLSIKELRAMARPLITARTYGKAKRPAMEKKAGVPASAKPRKNKGLPPEVHTVEELQIMDNGLHVHCMACGFRMEISAEGIKALQKG